MSARAAALALVLLAGCGGDGPSAAGGDRDPFTAIEREFDESRSEQPRAAPRFERVATLHGAGAGTRTVAIAAEAIQWRVRWECRSGSMRVAVEPEPSGGGSASGECPDGAASFIGTGERHLEVETGGSWRILVEQQVETPLSEPPLAGMNAGRAVARGRFASIERPSRGTATVYRLPSGRLALRFEGFETSANTDLFVWLSRARRPRTSRQALAAPYRVLGPLKSTLGEQNYLLPRRSDPDDLRSIVIWCEPIRIAYAAAPLRAAGARAPAA